MAEMGFRRDLGAATTLAAAPSPLVLQENRTSEKAEVIGKTTRLMKEFTPPTASGYFKERDD